MPELRQHFRSIVLPLAGETVEGTLWQEIAEAHSGPSRHYHTLDHLDHIHRVLASIENVEDRQALVIATAYHDLVQQMLRNDDEEQSAKLMRARMAAIGVPAATIDRAERHILATRDHLPTHDRDTDLFTDADLSILGTTPGEYARYADQVRAEYASVPDLIYNAGRRKVLKHFLQLPLIFKSPEFSDLVFTAKRNIQWELDRL